MLKIFFLLAPVMIATCAAQTLGQVGVSPAHVISKVDPDYTEEARRAHASGTVLLSLVVDANGAAQNIKVKRAVGLGLDEKAVEAVRQWRFEPGRRHDQPVSTTANIEVNFRLLADSSSPWTIHRLVFQTVEGLSRPMLLKSRLPHTAGGARDGKVSVDLEVGEDGKPREVVIGQSSDPAYEKEILGAVRKWRFEPARKNGSAMAVKGTLELSRGSL